MDKIAEKLSAVIELRERARRLLEVDEVKLAQSTSLQSLEKATGWLDGLIAVATEGD